MARMAYDDQTAAAFKAVREVPRDGLEHWRDAIGRHLRPLPRMTVADIGAGTGAFAAALATGSVSAFSRSNRRQRCGPRFRADWVSRHWKATPALCRFRMAPR